MHLKTVRSGRRDGVLTSLRPTEKVQLRLGFFGYDKIKWIMGVKQKHKKYSQTFEKNYSGGIAHTAQKRLACLQHQPLF